MKTPKAVKLQREAIKKVVEFLELKQCDASKSVACDRLHCPAHCYCRMELADLLREVFNLRPLKLNKGGR